MKPIPLILIKYLIVSAVLGVLAAMLGVVPALLLGKVFGATFVSRNDVIVILSLASVMTAAFVLAKVLRFDYEKSRLREEKLRMQDEKLRVQRETNAAAELWNSANKLFKASTELQELCSRNMPWIKDPMGFSFLQGEPAKPDIIPILHQGKLSTLFDKLKDIH